MTTLVHNRRQARKVRFVLWGSLIACALALWGGWSIFETFGLSPGDGGVLRPLWERAGFAAVVAAIGLVFAGGMLFYAKLYVLDLTVEGDTVAIDTMTLFGARQHRYVKSDIDGSAYHAGRIGVGAIARAPSVNAPWITLNVRGRRLPFIIDAQADTIQTDRLRAMAKGGGG